MVFDTVFILNFLRLNQKQEKHFCIYFYCIQHDFHISWCSCRLTVTRRVSLVDQELLPCRSTCVYFGLCLSFDLWFILYLHTFLIATQLIKWKMWFQIIIFLSEVKCFIIRCELRVLFQVTCILHLHILYVFGLFHSAGCLSFSCWYTTVI